MDFAIFRELLAGASDVSTVALLYVAWRLDRRLVVVETKLEKREERKHVGKAFSAAE